MRRGAPGETPPPPVATRGAHPQGLSRAVPYGAPVITIAPLLCVLAPLLDLADPGQVIGPVVGHVDQTSARIWLRPRTPDFKLQLRDASGAPHVGARSELDGSYVIHVTGLRPGARYTYRLADEGAERTGSFRTAPANPAARFRMAFGSCANHRRFPRQPVWETIAGHSPSVMVLLGDSPYIDSTDLKVQRERYREFFAMKDATRVLRDTPTWATWDDHDFGKNDTDGRLPGKENARRAFMEHHAHASYGAHGQGIYTSFRWGAAEIWLLDTRWFARTGPSPADANKKTLLGAAQWRWLLEGLKRSDATFKLLCSGMIWNGSVRPFKLDHWARYKHERDALWRRIGEEDISGVVLVGGDIHRSRALRHATTETAGYPLTELITSPLANTVITTAKVPHPGLLHDAAERNTFMLLHVDGQAEDPTLLAEIRNHEDKVLFTVRLKASELRRP